MVDIEKQVSEMSEELRQEWYNEVTKDLAGKCFKVSKDVYLKVIKPINYIGNNMIACEVQKVKITQGKESFDLSSEYRSILLEEEVSVEEYQNALKTVISKI